MSDGEGPGSGVSDDHSAPPELQCCRLSEELERVLVLTQQETVPVSVLVEHFKTRGHALFAFMLALPFLQPVPLPGVSTPIGAAIVLIGTFMALRLPPWLPKRWLEQELPSRHVSRVVRVGQRLMHRAERFIKPRGKWFHRHRWSQPIAGVVIAISGAQLALPLPILFTNTLPALVIAIVSVAMMEEDALLALLGGLLFLAVLVVFSAIFVLPFVGLRVVL